MPSLLPDLKEVMTLRYDRAVGPLDAAPLEEFTRDNLVLRVREHFHQEEAPVPTPSSEMPEVPAGAILELCRRYQVKELLVFGSGARGTLAASSDIDLLVEFEAEAVVGLVRFHQLQEELERLFGRRVDLVPKRGLNPAIRSAVLAEARVLHAA